MRAPGYSWLLLVASMLCACYLWKTRSISRWSSSMRAKALIIDLSIPSSPPSVVLHRSYHSRTVGARSSDNTARRRHRDALSRYMLQLYYRRPDAVVRAIQPVHTSAPLGDGGRILEFVIPSVDESLEGAELLGIAGTIIRVRSCYDLSATRNASAQILRSKKDDAWRAFDVTSAVLDRNSDVVKLYVHARLTYRPYGYSPILLLNYSKTNRTQRQRRFARQDQDEREVDERWTRGETPRRRRRNVCRRRPMYVDFALIAYDEWVIAPAGYEAYQCSGKCFYPFGDHLSPTKHAIVQTLVHGALHASEDLNGSKDVVGRACCVPTKLAPTSLLYLDASGTVTYQYGYEDMVVAECGCR